MSKFVYIQPLYGNEVIINIDQISSIKKYEPQDFMYHSSLGIVYRINLANKDVYEDIDEEEFNKLKRHIDFILD